MTTLVYLLNINKNTQMFSDHGSSNSDSNDHFDQKLFKRKEFNGIISNSEEDSLSQFQSPRQKQMNGKNMVFHKEGEFPMKNKPIKKNCESAKMSRQRKKVYLQLLEQRASQLKKEISMQKNNIANNSNLILNCIKRSNIHKYKFLQNKLSNSRKIVQQVQAVQCFKKQQKLDENEINPTIIKAQEFEFSFIKKEQLQFSNGLINRKTSDSVPKINFELKDQPHKQKNKKKQNEDNMQSGQIDNSALIMQREQEIQVAIKSYIYEFGVRGALRSDVIERVKKEYLLNIESSKIQNQCELLKSLEQMKNCFNQLEDKAKKVDYYLRQMKQHVKPQYVVHFLLDKQYFYRGQQETHKIQIDKE